MIRRYAVVVVAGFVLMSVVAGCSSDGNELTSTQTPTWTQAQIDTAFNSEWSAWKASKYDEMSQDQKDKLYMRGIRDPRSFVDKAHEHQAKPWKSELQREFSDRFGGYQKLIQRLESEKHPSPQAEKTAWFGALIGEVREKSGK